MSFWLKELGNVILIDIVIAFLIAVSYTHLRAHETL